MFVETISGVVAAVAAVGAVFFAWDTVQKTIAGQRIADQHHEVQIAEMKAATAASAKQHQVEMEDRHQVAAAELSNRQYAQMQRVCDLLVDYGDTAKAELTTPPPILRVETEAASISVSATRLPSLYARLEVEMIGLAMYGGRDMRSQLTEPSLTDPASVGRAWNESRTLLIKLADVAQIAAEETETQLATEQTLGADQERDEG